MYLYAAVSNLGSHQAVYNCATHEIHDRRSEAAGDLVVRRQTIVIIDEVAKPAFRRFLTPAIV